MSDSEIADIPRNDRIIPTVVEEEMQKSYLDYSMSVIVGRALPDFRDGLKPVHRRILFAMNDLGMVHSKPSKKCARIVGEVIGKYHPHGDTAAYDSLVRLAQDFSLRYPLVNGQGNFGSIDGDNAAAMRYTEAKLTKLADEILDDIKKDTVNFQPNFDGELKEPTVLPCRFPNLLVNGSSGIAVGMATNIPPHNMSEVCDGAIHVIDNPEASPDELMSFVKGPDFPTGGTIMGLNGVRSAYATGRGKLKVRAKTHFETVKNRESIIVDEIPYMVNKSMLIEQIADLVRNKSVPGIYDIRDESDKDGMRIVIELKHDATGEVVLNQIYKHSRLEVGIGITLLGLVDNAPRILSLKEVLKVFIDHRKEVVIRRTKFDLKKAEERAHIIEGLIIALESIDAVIEKIKKSKDVESAREMLMKDYSLSEIQAKAILEMRLQKLSSLEQEKIRDEHKSLGELMAELNAILSSDEKIFGIIKDELHAIKEKFGDERKTDLQEADDEDFCIEEMIEKHDVVVTISHKGYIKRIPTTTYREQGRGGRGVMAAAAKDEDFIEHLFVSSTHDTVLFFTTLGRVHWLKVYSVPEGSRQARGKAIVNMIRLQENEKIAAYVQVNEFDDKHFVMLCTESGTVKKTSLNAFSKPRKGGIIAINIADGDSLIGVALTDGDKQMIIATRDGQAVKFHESDVRAMGRTASGVRGVSLKGDDKAIGMVLAEDDKTLLTVTENGYGKRTMISEYRLIRRGGSGVKNIICSERNGRVVAVRQVVDDDGIMFITQKGIIIRTGAKGISTIGRSTQGVRVMRLDSGDKLIDVAKIIADESSEESSDNSSSDSSDDSHDESSVEISDESNNTSDKLSEESHDKTVDESADKSSD